MALVVGGGEARWKARDDVAGRGEEWGGVERRRGGATPVEGVNE